MKERVNETSEKYTPTDKQIENWKQKHGEVFSYESDELACYLKRPDRKTIAAAAAVGSTDPVKYAEIMIANCWLGGNEALKTEDRYFFGLQQQLTALVEIKTGTLKKL